MVAHVGFGWMPNGGRHLPEIFHRDEDPLMPGSPFVPQRIAKSVWVEPKLLAEIEYRAKSPEGKAQHLSSRPAGRSVAMIAAGSKWTSALVAHVGALLADLPESGIVI
jgi:hypothetical protein